MSTVLGDAALFAQDPDVFPPLTAALTQAAIDVMAEDPTTVAHGARTAFAANVLANPGALAGRFAWAVATNATVVASWVAGDHDGAINSFQFVVDSLFNAEAGVAT